MHAMTHERDARCKILYVDLFFFLFISEVGRDRWKTFYAVDDETSGKKTQ